MVKLELKSNYVERFKKLAATQGVTLTGNKMIVEEIKVDELKTASGLVLATKVDGYAKSAIQSGLTHVALVLMLGEDNNIPGSNNTVKVGDVVWLAEFGIRPITNFPGMLDSSAEQVLQLTDTSQIHMVFDGIAAYQSAINALNSATVEQVPANESNEEAGALFPNGQSGAV